MTSGAKPTQYGGTQPKAPAATAVCTASILHTGEEKAGNDERWEEETRHGADTVHRQREWERRGGAGTDGGSGESVHGQDGTAGGEGQRHRTAARRPRVGRTGRTPAGAGSQTNQPRSQRWLKTPYRTLPRATPTMGVRGARASEAGDALDEQRFTPPNIEARPSASGARRRSYTRGSEVGDRCRPSL